MHNSDVIVYGVQLSETPAGTDKEKEKGKGSNQFLI